MYEFHEKMKKVRLIRKKDPISLICKDIKKEINLLSEINTIVALGKIAFDACLNFYKESFLIKNKDFVFSHGCKYKLPDNKILVGSYHPSPRNVNTGRINTKKMVNLLEEVKKIIKDNKW